MINADLAALELRMTSNPARDLHTESAAELFGVHPSEVTPTQRRAGKARNYFDMYNRNPSMTTLTPKKTEPTSAPAGTSAPKERVPTAMELAMQAARRKKEAKK